MRRLVMVHAAKIVKRTLMTNRGLTRVATATSSSLKTWFSLLLFVGVFFAWTGTVCADDSEPYRYIHDASGRVIGTIERLSDGSERVHGHDGRYLGTADRSGTRDATGRTVSPEKVPGLLLLRAGDDRGGAGSH